MPLSPSILHLPLQLESSIGLHWQSFVTYPIFSDLNAALAIHQMAPCIEWRAPGLPGQTVS